ncbi:hypothetical protein [Methylobacterium sp. C25]|uniref:hypothetical protein n=1 Tax=Methylobacterium sp. C25 TaxID=2721622 RepID=UPI001F32CA01|nr:hypothetical protein [Methylobacterium sp. C25]
MRVVTLMCLALAGLVGVGGFGTPVLARGTSAQPQSTPTQQGGAAATQPGTAPVAPTTAARAGASPGLRGAEKRRRSYASCNRESHNRSLRGGARRRFLIRCKLGYERRRPGQAPTGQAAQPQTPPQPMARPNPPQNQAPAKPAAPQPQTQPQQPVKRP